METPENINPAYYKRGQVECIDAIEAATEGLSGRDAVCTGNAIKYLWRWKEKGGHEDLKKAIWYISRIIGEERVEKPAEAYAGDVPEWLKRVVSENWTLGECDFVGELWAALKQQLAEKDEEILRLRFTIRDLNGNMEAMKKASGEGTDKHYIEKLLADGLRLSKENEALRAENDELHTELERVNNAIVSQSHEIEQTLGKALGYPKFSDDQKNFPGSTGDDVCVGEHVAETLAMEAATMIANLREHSDLLEGWRDELTELIKTRYLETRTGTGIFQPRAHGTATDQQFSEALAAYRAEKAKGLI